jgi:hypothetical protein
MVALGCKVGTYYDGIAMHISLTMQWIAAVETAAGAPIHVRISETVYTVPGSAPDEQTKADATVSEFAAFAANSLIDGALYANVDECALYTSGFFINGCLIDTGGNHLPAWMALR